jgi:hypothetical protein
MCAPPTIFWTSSGVCGRNEGMSEVEKDAGDKAEQKAYAVAANTHWVFFETIDEDLHAYSRYLEFHEKNFAAFSINLARLYLSICSEVDVLAKMICERAVQSSKNKRLNIKDYRKIITGRFPAFGAAQVRIRPIQLIIRPWGEWVDTKDLNPKWWNDYNGVKHHRDKDFYLANLENVLHSAAGLYVVLILWYGPVIGDRHLDAKIRILEPYPSLQHWIAIDFSRSIPTA